MLPEGSEDLFFLFARTREDLVGVNCAFGTAEVDLGCERVGRAIVKMANYRFNFTYLN